MFKIGIPGVALIIAAFLIYPPLGFAVLSLALFVLGAGMLLYGGWLLIPYIPLIAFIWWSWDTIASWGFLGYWGVMGAILIPIIIMFERVLDKYTEYMGSVFAVMIWLGIAILFSTIEYWNIAQYVYIALFFIGCICVIAHNKEEKENV